MKISTILILLFSVFLLTTSCSKKDDTVTPTPAPVVEAITYPIQGLWIGTYTVDQTPSSGAQYFSYTVKPDGTMIYEAKNGSDEYIALGTWHLSGTNFTSSVTNIYTSIGAPTGVTQTSTATYDSTTGKLDNGTWTNPCCAASGTYNLTWYR